MTFCTVADFCKPEILVHVALQKQCTLISDLDGLSFQKKKMTQ